MSRRTIAEALPRFHGLTTSHIAGLIPWSAEWTIADSGAVERLAILVLDVQAGSSGASDLLAISDALRLDLMDLLATCEEPEISTIDCFRFLISLAPMRTTVALGRLRECYDWCKVSVSRTHDPNRRQNKELVNFPPGRSPLLDQVMSRLDEWSFTFFMLASKFGGMDELGAMCLKSSWYAALALFEVKDDKYMPVAAVASILSWTAERDLPELEGFVRAALELWNRTDLLGRVRAQLGMAFITKANCFSGRTPAEWAKLLLGEYRDYLVEHEPLQLLAVAIRTREEWKALRSEVLAEIAHMAQQARQFSNHMGASELATFEGKVRILYPLVTFLSEECDVADVIEVLAAWYRRPQAGPCDTNVLFVCPTNNQVIYAWPGGHWTSGPRAGALDALFVHMSAALGDYYRGPAGDRFMVLDERRAGDPVADEGPALEAAMAEYFLPQQLRRRIPTDFQPRSLVIFPSLPAPVQPLFQRDLGVSAPYESSLSAAALERPIRVVSVWLGSTFDTVLELEVLEAVSRLRGWNLKKTAPSEHPDPAAFRRFYEDPEADILWIIGHGEHTPHSEQETGIYLDEQRLLSMEEIGHFTCPDRGRRLLVLNICSGATARMTGGLARIGLAHQLVGPNQAVIAHIWPAYSETALSFGTLLATHLGVHDNFSAFASAAALLREPGSIVPALEKDLGSGLRAYERISSSAATLQNIASWGCPIFLT